MSATVTARPVEDLRRDLEHLLKLSTDVACAEEALVRFADKMEVSDVRHLCGELPYYRDAVVGGITGAVEDAKEPRSGPGTSIVDGMLIAQECQDALDVLDMAIARRDRERPDEAVAS